MEAPSLPSLPKVSGGLSFRALNYISADQKAFAQHESRINFTMLCLWGKKFNFYIKKTNIRETNNSNVL